MKWVQEVEIQQEGKEMDENFKKEKLNEAIECLKKSY
jgi:hypothetical protein